MRFEIRCMLGFVFLIELVACQKVEDDLFLVSLDSSRSISSEDIIEEQKGEVELQGYYIDCFGKEDFSSWKLSEYQSTLVVKKDDKSCQLHVEKVVYQKKMYTFREDSSYVLTDISENQKPIKLINENDLKDSTYAQMFITPADLSSKPVVTIILGDTPNFNQDFDMEVGSHLSVNNNDFSVIQVGVPDFIVDKKNFKISYDPQKKSALYNGNLLIKFKDSKQKYGGIYYKILSSNQKISNEYNNMVEYFVNNRSEFETFDSDRLLIKSSKIVQNASLKEENLEKDSEQKFKIIFVKIFNFDNEKSPLVESKNLVYAFSIYKIKIKTQLP